MFNRLIQFLSLTYAWIQAGVLALRQNTQPALDRIGELAEDWWDYARGLTPWVLGGTFLLFVIAIGADIGFGSGAPTAIAGMIIGLILFPLLVWYTPLIVIIGAVRQVLNLNLGSIPGELDKSTVWWFNAVIAILTWMLICTFMFSVIPFWNHIVSLPFLLLTGILLMMTGLIWKAKPWYQRWIRGSIMTVFVFHIVVCFFPPLSDAIQNYTGTKMEVVANWMNDSADRDRVKAANPDIATLTEDFDFLRKGEKVAVLGKPVKLAGEYEFTIEVVKKARGVYKGRKAFVPYRILSFNGNSDSASNSVQLVKKVVFKKTYTFDDAYDKKHGRVNTWNPVIDDVKVGDRVIIRARIIGSDKFHGEELYLVDAGNWVRTNIGKYSATINILQDNAYYMVSLDGRVDVEVSVSVKRKTVPGPNIDLLSTYLKE